MAEAEATVATGDGESRDHRKDGDSFFLSPPGVQISEAAESVRLVAFERVEHILGQLGDSVDRQQIIDALREAVLLKVDARVALKAQELWTRARQMVSQLQQRHKESTGRLLEEVARCRERQHALEAENDTLKQGIQSLTARISLLKEVLHGQDVGAAFAAAAAAEGSAVPALPPTQAQQPSPDFLSPGPFATPQCDGGFSPSQAALEACGAEMAAAGGVDCLWGGAKLPEVPPFPFQAPVLPPPGTPLSLVDALGADAPTQPAPVAFPEAAPPPPPPGVAPHIGRDFSFAMRKEAHAQEQDISAEVPWRDGSVEAWGHQWAGGAAAERALCEQQLGCAGSGGRLACELDEQREVPGAASQAEVSPTSKPWALRADASVFVPRGAEPPPAPQPASCPQGVEEATKAEGQADGLAGALS